MYYHVVSELSQALMRLTQMVRGIGDPLVAVYARCYLCRVIMSVHDADKTLIKQNLYDFLGCYHQVVICNNTSYSYRSILYKCVHLY